MSDAGNLAAAGAGQVVELAPMWALAGPMSLISLYITECFWVIAVGGAWKRIMI